MKKQTEQQSENVTLSNTQGEQERDNDAHRPDGSTGTAQDSTAQKTARQEQHKKR